MFITWLPFGYFMLFLVAAVGWRVYRVWRQTGVNALITYHTEGVYGLASAFLRVVFVGVTIVTFLHALPNVKKYLTPIDWLDHEFVFWAGWALLIIALLLVLIAQAQMGTVWRIGVDFAQEDLLVTEGIFQFSRNPIYLGVRMAYFGLLLVAPNAWLLAFWMLGDAIMQVQVRLEELYLLDTFGDQFSRYCTSVRRWI